MNASAVRSHHLLSLAAPAVIAGVEILLSVGSEAIEHKEFLGAQRSAEWTLNPRALILVDRFICHWRISICGLLSYRLCQRALYQCLRQGHLVSILLQRLRTLQRQSGSFRPDLCA